MGPTDETRKAAAITITPYPQTTTNRPKCTAKKLKYQGSMLERHYEDAIILGVYPLTQ